MNQRIKVGKVYLEIQQAGSAPIDAFPGRLPIKAEKPEMPEPLEEPQYIYRPSDPFQSPIDEARAIASIGPSHKPWVRKTWFVLFVIGPLVYAELKALAAALRVDETERWSAFLGINALILPLWGIYFAIWRRKVKEAVRPPAS